jgi:CubicO group peptidase (beta-lactamase class C family)
MAAVDELQLRRTVVQVLNRWPSAGVTVGVVGGGALEWFLGHGVADIPSKEPITQDTVFRIGSVTKTLTAVAVMQLWEQGLIDLDAPANEYLRTFRVTHTQRISPPTVRHLLTHTAGIGYWRRLSDLLRPGVGNQRVPIGVLARGILPKGAAGGGRTGQQVDVQQPWVRHARPRSSRT